MFVLGELNNMKDEKGKDEFENVMMQNTYLYEDGVWEQIGKAKFFIKEVDKEGKIVEIKEDESIAFGAAFLLVGLLGQSDPEIGKCIKKSFDGFKFN